MTNPDLPDDLLGRIAKLMAAKHWWYLESLLRAGNRGKKVVYRSDVLKEANIFNLCSNPDDIADGGRHRRFFERCLSAGNSTAIYFEGLRLVTRVGDIEGALRLLQRNVLAYVDATLVSAMFCICNGYGDQGGNLLRVFSKNHFPLDSEDVGELCEELITELRNYGTPNNNTYGVSFDYPDDGEITTPKCAIKCALTINVHMKGRYKHPCKKCTLWWCARRISLML